MSLDTLSVVDAVYRVALPDHDWLQGISDASACLGEGRGVYAFAYDARNPEQLRVGPVAGSGIYEGKSNLFAQMARAAPAFGAALTKRLYWGQWSVGFADELCAGRVPGLLKAAFKMAGASEAYAVRGQDRRRQGVMLTVPVRGGAKLGPRTRGALLEIAAHFAAAYRLRQSAAEAPEGPFFIFDRRGRLEHAAHSSHDCIDLAAVRGQVERFIGAQALRRQSPERAARLWVGLLEGHWSVFERVDADGRRFIVARENPANTPDPRALSFDERRVAWLASRGNAVKAIAYELKLSPSMVSYCIQRALRKLGLRHKAELVGLFEASSSMPARVPRSQALVPHALRAYVSAASTDRFVVSSFDVVRRGLAPQLNRSESEVARMVSLGRSNSEIARARGVSVCTVANQLRSAFQKLGVHSRAELLLALSSSMERRHGTP